MAKRSRIRIEKKEVSSDGSIPTDGAGQPDRRDLAVTTVWAEREDSEAGSGEDLTDDAVQSVQTAIFSFYDPEASIDTSMRIVDTTDNDTTYEIREVRKKMTAPQELEVQAVRQPVD